MKRTPATLRALAALVLIAPVGCSGGEVPTALVPEASNAAALAGLSPTFSAWKELSGAPAFSLRLANDGDAAIEDVRLVLDDTHAAALTDLRLYRGVVSGTATPADSTLDPGESHEFVFSHDTSNFHALRDADDAPLQPTLPERITVRSAAGAASWSVQR